MHTHAVREITRHRGGQVQHWDWEKLSKLKEPLGAAALIKEKK